MNFTRDPIIETVITPKDGYKLVLRSSKRDGAEEYSVEAIEVVCFGSALFYRSLERPKSFLVPVSDFEVVETKETRVVLKNATIEKSIKIAGGKVDKKEEEPKKKARRSSRRTKTPDEHTSVDKTDVKKEIKAKTKEAPKEKAVRAPGPFRPLLPPPTSLISDKIQEEKERLQLVDIDAPPKPQEVTADKGTEKE
ncbi:MAG: hypothetical protein P0S94_03590 [Simkaniaceae bacterium]|nr:hypothetical protein [Simkaniaceae bacterium]